MIRDFFQIADKIPQNIRTAKCPLVRMSTSEYTFWVFSEKYSKLCKQIYYPIILSTQLLIQVVSNNMLHIAGSEIRKLVYAGTKSEQTMSQQCFMFAWTPKDL